MFKSIPHAYLNTNQNHYPYDYVNLASIDDGKIQFPQRTSFLSDEEKTQLSLDTLRHYEDACFITYIDGIYSLIALVDLKAPIKQHEFVLPDVITGMVLNYQHYNTEAAPITLLSKEAIDYESMVSSLESIHVQEYGEDRVYVYDGKAKDTILSELNKIDNLYLADGHHRFLASQHIIHKNTCLAMMSNVEDATIESITRSMVLKEPFETSLHYLESEGFQMNPGPLQRGAVAIEHEDHHYVYELQSMAHDVFGDHDIYRLHTQIISQGFKEYDSSQLQYSRDGIYKDNWINFKTVAMSMEDFLDYADQGIILPPKSTAIYPKCPSLLVMNRFILE